MKNKLTVKQKKFADEYIKTGNATQSYLDAGYSMKSKNGAGVEGQKLLRKRRKHRKHRRRDQHERSAKRQQ